MTYYHGRPLLPLSGSVIVVDRYSVGPDDGGHWRRAPDVLMPGTSSLLRAALQCAVVLYSQRGTLQPYTATSQIYRDRAVAGLQIARGIER